MRKIKLLELVQNFQLKFNFSKDSLPKDKKIIRKRIEDLTKGFHFQADKYYHKEKTMHPLWHFVKYIENDDGMFCVKIDIRPFPLKQRGFRLYSYADSVVEAKDMINLQNLDDYIITGKVPILSH